MKDSKENELDFLESAIEFEDIIIRYRLIPKEEVEGLDVMGNYYLFTIQQKHIKKFLNSFCDINGLPEVGDRLKLHTQAFSIEIVELLPV
jgi:hypothetical protein